jgi:hypothetical protein
MNAPSLLIQPTFISSILCIKTSSTYSLLGIGQESSPQNDRVEADYRAGKTPNTASKGRGKIVGD